MIIPKAIATAKSATPKMFQRIAAFRPSAVPELAWSEVGAFKAEPQAEHEQSMDHQPNGQGRKAALRKHW
jgi:hypothetical protein